MGARTVSEAMGAEGARLGVLGTHRVQENRDITQSCGARQPEASQASIRAQRTGQLLTLATQHLLPSEPALLPCLLPPRSPVQWERPQENREETAPAHH